MIVEPRECMFCHDVMPKLEGQPVNLAFMAHLENEATCRDAFDAWTENMAADFKGD
jgi:hypothetical protein